MLIFLNKLFGRIEERVVKASSTKSQRGKRKPAKPQVDLVCVDIKGVKERWQQGSIGKIGIIVSCVAFFISIMLPIGIAMGVVSFVAGFFFKLPGVVAVFKVLLGVWCFVGKTLKGAISAAKDTGGLISKVSKKIKNATTDLIGYAGKGLKVIPLVGGQLSGGVSIAGKVITSPLLVVEKAGDLMKMGMSVLQSINKFACGKNGLQGIIKEMERNGSKAALQKALSCADWDASRYGKLDSPQNSTKDGTPKYCIDGEIKGEDNTYFIPNWLLGIYQEAGRKYNVPWEVLAAININDTNLGKSQWMEANEDTQGHVGWIPFTRSEWYGSRNSKAYAINDAGGTAPNFYGNPYSGKKGYTVTPVDPKAKDYNPAKPFKKEITKEGVCPAPIDTNGNAWQGGIGKITPADNKAETSDAGLQNYKGGKMTAEQVGQVLIQVGFPKEEIYPGIIAAYLESGFDPGATNGSSTPVVDSAAGLFQMLGPEKLGPLKKYAGGKEPAWKDPIANTKVALDLYKSALSGTGYGWQPWQAMPNGVQSKWDSIAGKDEAIKQAKAAAQKLGVPITPQSKWGKSKAYGKGGGIDLGAQGQKNRDLSVKSIDPVIRQYLNGRQGDPGYRVQTAAGRTIMDYRFDGSKKTLKREVQGYRLTVSANSNIPTRELQVALNNVYKQLNAALNSGGTSKDDAGNEYVSGASQDYGKTVPAGGGYKLLKSQAIMADIIAKRTGVDVNVIRAQIINEQGDARNPAASNREKAKNYNWLNIGWQDNGRTSFSYDEVWGDPEKAGNATADFIQGKGKVHGSPGIVEAYKKAKGADPKTVTKLIGNSGWATSKYADSSGTPGGLIYAVYKRLEKIDQPEGSAEDDENSPKDVLVSLDSDYQYDNCDPVDSVFGLAQWLSMNGARGQIWTEAYPTAEEIEAARKKDRLTGDQVKSGDDDAAGDGSLSAFMEAAKKVADKKVKYRWGGGHEAPKVTDAMMAKGLDCSGSVSYVLQNAGVKMQSQVSGSMGTELSKFKWKKGDGGDDAVTVYYNAGHTFMRIGKKYFGTSVGDNGGPINGSPKGSPQFRSAPSKGYLTSYQKIHIVPSGGDDAKSDTSSSDDESAVSFDESAANDAIKELKTPTAGFSVADANGKIIYSHQGSKTNNSASVVKMMFAAALADKYSDKAIPANVQAALEGMILKSNNGNANTVLKTVGRGGVNAIAKKAGMKNFSINLKSSCPLSGSNLQAGSSCFAAGSSKITSDDQARFVAQLDKIIKGKNKDLIRDYLSKGDSEGQVGKGSGDTDNADFGVYKAKIADVISDRKSGWRPESGYKNWTINQTVQIKSGDSIWGVSFVTGGGNNFDTVAKQITSVMDKSFKAKSEKDFEAGSAGADANGQILPACFTKNAKKFGKIEALVAKNKKSGGNYKALALDTCLGEADAPAKESCNPNGDDYGSQEIRGDLATETQAAAQTYQLPDRNMLLGIIRVQSYNGCDMPNGDDSEGWVGFSKKQWNQYGVNTDKNDREFSSRGNSTDSAFALARYIKSKLGKDGDMSKKGIAIARRFFIENGSKSREAQAKVAMLQAYLKTTTGGDNNIVKSPIGKAVQLRNYRIDTQLAMGPDAPCKDDTVYSVCISKIYKLIVLEYEKPSQIDREKDQTDGVLPGGCGKPEGDGDKFSDFQGTKKIKISDVPDLSIKTYSTKGSDLVMNKERKNINSVNRQTYGRRDAMKGTVAVIKAFQECFPAFKKKWKDIQVNDWGSQIVGAKYGLPGGNGHLSHRNGGDNDFTILNVTSFQLPGQQYKRKEAIVLASLFLRAGAYWIFFDDPELQEFFIKNRAAEAKLNPSFKKRYKAWSDTPMLWAYGGTPGSASGLGANSAHHNHYHVRWYSSNANAANPKVRVYLGDNSKTDDDVGDKENDTGKGKGGKDANKGPWDTGALGIDQYGEGLDEEKKDTKEKDKNKKK